MFFAFFGVAGEGVSFHWRSALPAVDAPLPEGFVIFLCGHHGDILGDANLVGAAVGADAVGLEAVKDQEIAGLQGDFDDIEPGSIGFVVIAVFGLCQLPGVIGPV